MGAILMAVMLMLGCPGAPPETPPGNGGDGQVKEPSSVNGGFTFMQASGEIDIQEALDSAYKGYYGYSIGGRAADAVPEAAPTTAEGWEETVDSGAQAPSDYSTTNVQVVGVDELDIVKVDSQTGTELYVLSGDMLNFLNAYPPADLERYAEAETEWGDGIYEYDDVVIAISYDKIEAFNKDDGERAWHINLNSTYVDSRMVDGIIYLVLQEYPYAPYRPMPLERCAGGVCSSLVIDYTSVYIPQGISSEVFYDVISLEASTGEIMDSKAFMGPYSSTLYMSRQNLYVGMYQRESETKVLFEFLLTDGLGILPQELQDRLEYLDSLDISDEAKTLEFSIALEQWMSRASDEEAANLFNDLEDGLDVYITAYPEKLEYTGIARIAYEGTGALSEPDTGIVPGRLLNQFAMDEYQNNLRVAVTYGSWSNSENGVLVLDSNMNEVGRAVGLAEGESVYAVRFIGRYGYVVTFRQIDPLFIIDLYDPYNPEVKGELKVPGYSTYLHPIGADQLLGIGKQDGNVKISLFDISDPTDPTELDSFIMDEYWSEAIYNHHAFLHYEAKNLVVLPIGSSDYVFRVKDGQISLRKIIREDAVRNVYMDEYLYIITNDEVVVYNFDTYDEVAREDLEGYTSRWYGSDIVYEELPPETDASSVEE